LGACAAGKEIEDQIAKEFSNQGLPQSQLLGFELEDKLISKVALFNDIFNN